MKLQLIRALQDIRAQGRSAVVVTDLASGAQRLLEPDRAPDDPLSETALAAIRADRSQPVTLDGGEYFLQVFNPPLRLIVVGAVHVAQALVPMARMAGYDVTVVDPRRTFATEERFPDAAVDTRWPGEALSALAPDQRTAVVTLSHDPKIDDPALRTALSSDVFYVGALGSRRTHAKRLDRLPGEGLSDAQLERIHAPVGLDIGARSPAEIAISVMAEITQVLRQVPAG